MTTGIAASDREGALSELAKLGAKLIIQRAVEEEFDSFLGRARYERRPEAPPGKRNGYRPRRVQAAEGELELEVPQVREAAEPFTSKLFPRGKRLLDRSRLEAERTLEQARAEAETTAWEARSTQSASATRAIKTSSAGSSTTTAGFDGGRTTPTHPRRCRSTPSETTSAIAGHPPVEATVIGQRFRLARGRCMASQRARQAS